MRPRWIRTCDYWICSQTHYRLRCGAEYCFRCFRHLVIRLKECKLFLFRVDPFQNNLDCITFPVSVSFLFDLTSYMGSVKPKSALLYAQNVRFHIILHIRKLIRAFAPHWNILQYPVILLVNSECPDRTARMRRLIWAFAGRICQNLRIHVFAWRGSLYSKTSMTRTSMAHLPKSHPFVFGPGTMINP